MQRRGVWSGLSACIRQATWTAVALLLLLCPRFCPAQPVFESKKLGLRIESIHWGWKGDNLLPERTNPVFLFISSEDRAASGVCMLEFPQDGSQVARVITPFSTTPGRAVPVEMAICPARRCEWIKLSITDGRRVETLMYSNTGASGSRPMPALLESPLTIGVLAPMRVTVLQNNTDFSNPVSSMNPSNPWRGGMNPGVFGPIKYPDPLDSGTITRVEPAMMSTGWLAYESLDVLVAREDDLLKVDRRALDALATWVSAGGRLCVLVSPAGSRVHELLPEDTRGLFEFFASEPVQAGDELAERLKGEVVRVTTDPVAARVFRPTDAGRRAGWSVRWRAGGADVRDQSGLLIEGPAGLGKVVLIGVDPARLSSVVHDRNTRILWRDAIADLLPHWSHDRNDDPGFNSLYYGIGSGDDVQCAAALRNRLDVVTVTPPIGSGFFLVTLGAMFVLVLAVGPLGRVVLRRRALLSLNWLVALCCIGVACAVGAVVPMVMRSGQTAIGRYTLVDARCDEAGDLSRAWSTSIVGVFAGRPGEMTIPVLSDLSWTRGISTAQAWRAQGSRLAPIELIYTLPGASQREGLSMSPVQFSQWTFRAFLQHAIGAPDGCRMLHITRSQANDKPSFIVKGLPGTARVVSATLHEDEATYTLTCTDEGGGVVRLIGDTPGSERESLTVAGGYVEKQNQYYWYVQEPGTITIKPEHSMPLARARNASLETLSSGGRGSLLVLILEDVPMPRDEAHSEDRVTTHAMTLRVVLPRPAPSAAGDTP